MDIKPGVAVVSDIAAHNAETLYGPAMRTLPALCDLAEICQAAVLNETVAVSPTAYRGSTLLRSLEFVPDLMPTVTEASAEAADAQPEDDDPVVIEVKDGELTSDHPLGRLTLAMTAGELLQDSGMFGGLANPAGIRPEERAAFYLDKLPLFVFLLQAKKGAGLFDSEESRAYLLEQTAPDRTAYEQYVTRLLALHETAGAEPTFSCLEEPLADDIRVERAIGTVQTPTLWRRFRTMLEDAVKGDRSEYFDRWTVPPLGLMVLGGAPTLDDVPGEIARLRERFDQARSRLVALEQDKHAALTEGGGLDDRRYRGVVAIDQQIEKAFGAFDESLAQHRRAGEIKRAEWVFNAPKYLAWLVSLGVGSFEHLIEVANLRRRHYMSYVPGLHKTLSFVKSCDDAYVVEIAERLLGRPFEAYGLHAALLQLAAQKVEAYAVYADGAAPPDDDAMTIDGVRLPHAELWLRLVRDDELRRLMLHPQYG
jgi:hypothetical protein